jgi:branched-chain amino acid transport system substrate-binding protein
VIYAKHALATVSPKVGVLIQNDDYGKDYFGGFKRPWQRSGRIVKLVTYEPNRSDGRVADHQLKDSGANVFFNVSTPKFTAQSIRKSADGWKPVRHLNNVDVDGRHESRGFQKTIRTSSPQRTSESSTTVGGQCRGEGLAQWMTKWIPGGNRQDGNYLRAVTTMILGR